MAGEDGDGEDEAEEDEDYDSEMDDDMEGGEGRKKASKKRPKRPAKTIFNMFEPKELEDRHFTDQDNEVRNTDIPERMQLRSTPVTALPEGGNADQELEKEADWIFRHGFTKATVSRQEG